MNLTSNTTNTTGLDLDPAPAGPSLRDWIKVVTSTGCWFATAWLTLSIFVTHWLGLYVKYPAVTIRWVLYIELGYNIIIGPLKWWSKSPFHDALALNPTVASCYWTIFSNTFVAIGLMFLGCVAAFSLYQITSGRSPITDEESRKLTMRAAAAFWVLSLGISGLNVSSGYKVILWCHSSSDFATVIKFGLMFIMMVLQFYWVTRSLHRIFSFSRKVHNLTKVEDDNSVDGNAEEPGNKESNRRFSAPAHSVRETLLRGIPRSQVLLALRFAVVLLTEMIMVFPNGYVEFSLNFIAPTVSPWVVKMLSVGIFLGPILDGALVWTHEKVTRSVGQIVRGSVTTHRSTIRSTQNHARLSST